MTVVPRPSIRRAGWISRRPTLLLGTILIGLVVAVALVSLVWTPEPPARMQILAKLKPPLAQGLLGTDQLGRDMASRLMLGAWNSLSTAAAAVALGSVVGTVLGLTAAARRGFAEGVIMRLNDVIFAIPPILSAMILTAFIGGGLGTAIIAIAVFMVPVFARVTASGASQIWARDFVLAARAAGKNRLQISLEHVLPNILNQIIVQVTIQLGLAILTEAGLSFLGLGMAPPAPTWGRMLSEAGTFIGTAPWLAILPGLAIAITVLGFNMLGDGLRDLLDPRTTERA